MTIQHTTREIYRIMHAYARNEMKHRGDGNADSAYDAADRAANIYFHHFGYDAGIERVVAISNAVLWAVHWQHFQPVHAGLKLWQSERRYSWNVNGCGETRHHAPRLPA